MAGKKPRSAAQRAATKKLVALNRARARGASAPRRASRPKKRARARSTSNTAVVRRKTSRRSGSRGPGGWPITSRAAASVAGRKLRRRRPNPIMSDIKDTFIPSMVGGGGALLLDVALGVLPIPAQMKTPAMAPVIRIAGAIGLGMALKATKVVSGRTANQIAAGALTVTLYDIAKGFLRRTMPGKIPGLGAAWGTGYDDMGAYGIDGVGAYGVDGIGDDGDDGESVLGYDDSGMTVGELMPDGSIAGFETGVYR